PDAPARDRATGRWVLAATGVLVATAGLRSAGVLSDTAGLALMAAALVGMGLRLLVAPAASPQTVEAFGRGRALHVARVLGAVVLVLGAVLAGVAVDTLAR
ncbi:MAG TPA: hypothetical protein VF576_01415, partial [Rubricoccaceae bacterium]